MNWDELNKFVVCTDDLTLNNNENIPVHPYFTNHGSSLELWYGQDYEHTMVFNKSDTKIDIVAKGSIRLRNKNCEAILTVDLGI